MGQQGTSQASTPAAFRFHHDKPNVGPTLLLRKCRRNWRQIVRPLTLAANLQLHFVGCATAGSAPCGRQAIVPWPNTCVVYGRSYRHCCKCQRQSARPCCANSERPPWLVSALLDQCPSKALRTGKQFARKNAASFCRLQRGRGRGAWSASRFEKPDGRAQRRERQ